MVTANNKNTTCVNYKFIINDYLKQIARYNYNYFNLKKNNIKTNYNEHRAFRLLHDDENSNNYNFIKVENYIEGCTRTFLINVIFKELLEKYNIDNEWFFNSTFSKYTITNRDYELGMPIEFIVNYNGKKIGFRYTQFSFNSNELLLKGFENSFDVIGEKIIGFDRLSPIDDLIVIDWSSTSQLDIDKFEKSPIGKKLSSTLSLKEFFLTFFTIDEYDLFINHTKEAIKQAKQIIGLEAMPQLLAENILKFKNNILNEFSKEYVDKLVYDFHEKTTPQLELSEDDKNKMKKVFFDDDLRLAIVGSSNFSNSFITSEYLFKNISNNVSIDYTAIVTGYLKSIEQLLYIYYESSFQDKSRISIWKKMNPKFYNKFDISKPNFKYDPYSTTKKIYMEKYECNKDKNISFNMLNKHIRYYEEIWNISEEGKEFIIKCLNDFRITCRNSLFHKDNIEPKDYDKVIRIRNNTHVCLFYIISGFKLLNESSSINEQLGIENYSFDNFFTNYLQRGYHLFLVELQCGYKGLIHYCGDSFYQRTNTGIIKTDGLPFIKLNSMSENNAPINEIIELLHNNNYIEKNKIIITRDEMPIIIKKCNYTKI